MILVLAILWCLARGLVAEFWADDVDDLGDDDDDDPPLRPRTT